MTRDSGTVIVAAKPEQKTRMMTADRAGEDPKPVGRRPVTGSDARKDMRRTACSRMNGVGSMWQNPSEKRFVTPEIRF